MGLKELIKMERFPAKLLLFGEYTVLKGSDALAIPWNAFTGRWADSGRSQDAIMSSNILTRLADWLGNQADLNTFLDIERFCKDIEKGLWFCSNIPTGGGLGSSGALTAAVAHRYGKRLPDNLSLLRMILGKMESFFHQNSSGIDPLTAFLKHPVLVSEKGTSTTLNPFAFQGCPWHLFLVPTGKEGLTYSSVNEFFTITDDDSLFRLKALNNQLVDVVLHYNMDAFDYILRELSELQMTLFGPLVGEAGLKKMSEGLSSQKYTLKLCGSGSGFLLGFTQFPDLLPEYFRSFQLISFS